MNERPAFPLAGNYSTSAHGPSGWYDLRDFICLEIGHRLIYWSEHGYSYPSRANPETGKDWSPEEWAAMLKAHGQALLDYQAARGNDDAIAMERLSAAQEAMLFLSEHLDTLWD